MARIAANPRIHRDRLHQGAWELLVDAMQCSYSELKQRALTWEALVDPIGALDKADNARQIRDITLTPKAAGGWVLSGSLDDIGGAEFNEILAYLIDAEWRADWVETQPCHATRNHCAPVTTSTKNTASECSETTPAPGTQSAQTESKSPDQNASLPTRFEVI
jgi:hypothetical protein